MFHAMFLSVLLGATATTGFSAVPVQSQPAGGPPAKPVPQPTPPEQPGVVPMLQAEAELLKPLTTSKLCWSFLSATATLPDPGTRAVMRNQKKGITLSVEQFDKLPEADRAGFVKREFQPRFYYYTGYGTPLIYARPLDLLAENDKDNWTPDKLPSKRILDFGCGTMGHLRLLASLGADVTGVDVEPMFDALYSKPEDQGDVEGADGKKGHVRLLTGQWPADPDIVKKVKDRQGDGYDLFLSKNTLKRGYIHPARYADPSRLVHLGVEDEAFVKAVYDSLKPGGIFMIYNISPRQAPADKPYIPHADGQCPFPRELLEKTGFEVIKYDENDQDGILKYWMALGYNEGKDEEGTKHDLFAWWTMCRKPARHADAGAKGEIRITRNYAAEYNAEIAKIPEEQRAWPVYMEAVLKLSPLPKNLADAGWPLRPDDKLWSEALKYLDENKEALRLVRRATLRPHLGMPMSDQLDPAFEQALAARDGKVFEPVAPSDNPVLVEVLLPSLGYLRTFARLLVVDARKCVVDGRAAEFVEDCRAFASLGRHGSEPPLLLGSMVCIALHSLLYSVVMDTLDAHPGLLKDDQLIAVSALLESIDDTEIVSGDLASERLFLVDFLQRAFTDDGKGDGVMCDAGWKILERLSTDLDASAPWKVPQFIKSEVAGRAEMLAEYDAVTAKEKAIVARPLWEWEERPDDVGKSSVEAAGSRWKYLIVGIMLPSLTKAGLAMTQGVQQRDAALVAIALERYRRKHGSYPATLDALVPEFLAAVPPDRFDGKPIKYRLVDAKPLLYSVGTDRDDDQGRYPEGNRWAANVWRSPAELAAFMRGDPDAPDVPDGDFVLYPEPQD